MEPKVLLMDEPLSNLDAKLREEMRTEIRRIQKELNITSVYVTHDQIEAMTLSDRIVVMNLGIIEQIGSPMEIYRFPNSRFVANFIGRANFIDGVVLAQDGSSLTVKSLGETITLSNIKREFHKGEDVTLIVRPEMIHIKKTGGVYKGGVRRAVYLGDVIEYAVEISGASILGIETDPHVTELFPEGEKVTLDFAEDCIQVLPAGKKPA
jgi:iron(III) transport system ATP-binding protein